MIQIPMRTKGGMNAREHYGQRSRRVKAERDIVARGLAYFWKPERPATPCTVHLTRVAPSSGLDDDNLASALKAVRDEFAKWMGVDDKLRDVVRYVYDQKRGPWGVEISVTAGIASLLPDTGLSPMDGV